MRPGPDIALLFPPLWYFTSVPADLSYTSGALARRGVKVVAHDLNAGFIHDLFGREPSFRALQRSDTYLDQQTLRATAAALARTGNRIARRFEVELSLRHLGFPGLDEDHVPSALAVGLSGRRNPALPCLRKVARELLAHPPAVVAVALVHPEQRVHALALGRLIRRGGFSGKLVLYGSLEDVLSPADFAADLVGQPAHLVFRDFDGVIAGEAESALFALAERARVIPNFIRAEDTGRGLRLLEEIEAVSFPDFSWVRPEIYPYPTPIVDLRLGRGCPFGRCVFCAIQAHQAGYRPGRVEQLIEAMERAHGELGSVFFRIRDNLLSAAQLRALAGRTAQCSFRPRWLARARFEEGLDAPTLKIAGEGGLEELWLGLESAVPKIRERMAKDVAQHEIVRIFTEAPRADVRIRPLCMVGFPGETASEARRTVGFLVRHAEVLAGVSITPFQLMRQSAMAKSPERFGVVVGEFVHPRIERLAYALPIQHAPGMQPAEVSAVYREALDRLGPLFQQRNLGPDPAHGWLAASLQRRAVG